jgi:hypothetical protein
MKETAELSRELDTLVDDIMCNTDEKDIGKERITRIATRYSLPVDDLVLSIHKKIKEYVCRNSWSLSGEVYG